jgi:DNA replication factor GINS
MNLEDLRAAQSRERATDGLQDLRDSFYGDVAEDLESLKDRRDDAAAASTDPFGDPEVQELTDKIETAEQVAEAIYERRMGKLVKQASLAAAGVPDDENGLTDEERELYTDLVERIEANKSHVLDVISGDIDLTRSADVDDHADATPADNTVSVDEPGTEPGSPPDAASNSSAAAAMGGGLDDPAEDTTAEEDTPSSGSAGAAGEESADESTDGGETLDRTTVRVTRDVGEIFGVDERPYSLEAEDVVTLPDENAEPLVEKGAAEKLE